MKALRRSNTSSPSSSWIHLRSLLIVASSPVPDRGSLKSPWSRRKRKRALSRRQWNSLFSLDGKLRDGGVKFLKKARSGGIDPSIRAEVWPFLLGVYDLNSTESERSNIKRQKRAEYEILRRRCRQLLNHHKVSELKGIDEASRKGSPSLNEDPESPFSEDFSARPSLGIEEGSGNEDQPVFVTTPDRNACSVEEVGDNEDQPVFDRTPDSNACNVKEGRTYEDQAMYDKTPDSNSCNVEEDSREITRIDASAMYDKTPDSNTRNVEEDSSESTRIDASAMYDKTPDSNTCNVEEDSSEITHIDASAVETESSDSESSVEDDEGMPVPSITEGLIEPYPKCAKTASLKGDLPNQTTEDFATWQRIIRLDAVRANAEWVIYSPNQATVSEDKANQSAIAVGLKDYDHLEPCMIYHAARLVAVLEAYALYDPEIGYCQGMSDLLSPILAVIEEDQEAFWCFAGFMLKARHNFRLDEVGIRRQLGIVAKIIKSKDLHLYRHLEKLQAEDCFFLYRMVVVLFRRELSFEQTVCLWEVMWADQAAIRAGISKSTWGSIRLRAPPTDDLLLYAISACVLRRRKLIIEKYSSMDEIIRECNNMAGQLDVWRLLDDAHDLVVTLHDKI